MNKIFKKFTVEELIKMAETKTYTQMAREAGVSVAYMWKTCRKYQIVADAKTKYDKLPEKEVREMAKKCTYKEMTERLGVSQITIHKFLAINKIKKIDGRTGKLYQPEWP
jgi:uncharacterized protein YerC